MGSSCERLQSQTENVARGINVPVVDRAASVAAPHSLIQTCSAFRSSHAFACCAGSACVCLGNFKHAAAIPNGLVRQHRLEARPANIVLGFGNVADCRFSDDVLRAHVTDNDEPVLLSQLAALLMQKILTPISNLGVNSADPLTFTRTLGFRQPRFTVTIETRRDNPVLI